MIADFIHQGGSSSSAISRTPLKNLNWCRISGADQKATTVSTGGQPGTPQLSSATNTTASSSSRKRRRVHRFSRATARLYPAPRLGPNIINAYSLQRASSWPR